MHFVKILLIERFVLDIFNLRLKDEKGQGSWYDPCPCPLGSAADGSPYGNTIGKNLSAAGVNPIGRKDFAMAEVTYPCYIQRKDGKGQWYWVYD